MLDESLETDFKGSKNFTLWLGNPETKSNLNRRYIGAMSEIYLWSKTLSLENLKQLVSK